MKKILSVFLTVALVFGACACGQAPANGTDGKKENEGMTAQNPIVVLGPMECEFTTLAGLVDNPSKVTIGSYQFVEGTVDGYPVVVVRSLIGMVNAAAATTLAINEYSPIAVIIQGTSGGHDYDLHQGDIILGQNIIETQSYYSPHRDEGDGSIYQDWSYPGEEMLVMGNIVRVRSLHSDDNFLNLAYNVPYEHGRLLFGTHGTADAWNKEIDKIHFLHENMGTDCEEMECFAVAQVCQQFDVPFLAIRIISNSELHPEEPFDEIFGTYCQEYTYDVIKEMIEYYKTL